MGRMQVCRICRSEENLKYTTKELRQLNKKQLLLAQAAQQGQDSKASKKLLLTTPTLGNICRECDERLQIFHRLGDDGDHDNCSDIEIDVVNNTSNSPLSLRMSTSMTKEDFLQRKERPETPVIVDDNDMLYNIFMQKIDQQKQFRSQQHTDTSMIVQQNQQFVNQFHTTYTPPQSSTSGSEGDESKVIEILTSRESTPSSAIPPVPAKTNSNLVDEQGHRIVAIIELDDCDEFESKSNELDAKNSSISTPTTSCSNDLSVSDTNDRELNQTLTPQNTKQLDDDEEIVFRKVDTEKDISLAQRKRKRKSYDDKQLRLVASLSLISSDSETEEGPAKKILSETDNTIKVHTTASVITKEVKKFVTCDFCKLKFPDSESLSVHQSIHKGEKCILCQVGFTQTKRLIHHMRRKHRSYNGNVLSEKPRSGQDSCMTIRLRYMQHTTFYECQLCGRIDEIFKDHKDHIMEKHANESKSLKDPMMKQLKCPVCKVKCGAQYLSLCRHLISTHEYHEFKSHLRELIHVSAFGWNAARQQEVAKTAKIFQFVKRKTFFFECKVCRKVVSGYLHHLRHVNNHQTSIINSKINSPSKTSEECIKESEKSANVLIKLDTSKQTAKTKQQPKRLLGIKDNTKKIFTSTTTENMKTYKRNNSNSNLSANPKPYDAETKSSKSNAKIKIKLKPKDTVKNKQSVVKLTKARPKKDSLSNKTKDNEKIKFKGKGKDNVQKPQIIKVKIKPPIRQIDLQKYKCIYCLKKFKGFRLFNLHLLRQHKDCEYNKCLKCNKAFKSSLTLDEHKKECTNVYFLSKRKSKTCLMLQNSSESSKKVPETCEIRSNIENNNYEWLQDLLKLNESSKASDSYSNTALYINNYNTNLFKNVQCSYCLHLFTDENSLNNHTKERHTQQENIFIKYKPLKMNNT